MRRNDPPRVVARRLAARTRVFHIEEVDLVFANGAHRTYERIVGPAEGAVLVVPLREDTVLLVREYATGMDRYELSFVKGNVDAGEALLDAANRELQEEIGFAARRLELLYSMTTAPGYLRHNTHVVVAEGLYPRTGEGDEPEPLQIVPWALDGLEELLDHHEFTDARSVAALYLLERYLRR